MFRQLFFLSIIALAFAVTVFGSIVYAGYTGLVLGTDIMFYLPGTGTYVYWDTPLYVDSFEIDETSIYFYGASFDGINFRDFGISVSNANVSIDAITSQYVKLTLYAPAGTISQLDFYSPTMPLTVRVVYGTAEEIIQDSDYFHDMASWSNAKAPSVLYTDHMRVKVEHHSPVTLYIYFIRYTPSSSSSSGSNAQPHGGIGGLVTNNTVQAIEIPAITDANIGLAIIILSVIGIFFYKELNKPIPKVWSERRKKLMKKRVKWKKYKKPWE